MFNRNQIYEWLEAMRSIYTAQTVAATDLFAHFSDDWAEKYPAMIRAWENTWDEFTPFLAFPTEIRKIVYTTNSIESLNARFRRTVRHRGFPHRTGSNGSPVWGVTRRTVQDPEQGQRSERGHQA